MRKFCTYSRLTILWYLPLNFFLGCAGSIKTPLDINPSEMEKSPSITRIDIKSYQKPKVSNLEKIDIESIDYDFEKMVIKWYKSNDLNFEQYMLFKSRHEFGDMDTLYITEQIDDTSFSLYEFDPTKQNWFWVNIKNDHGLIKEGEKSTHYLESDPPDATTLFPAKFDGPLTIRWKKNRNNDFAFYNIYRSIKPDVNLMNPFEKIKIQNDTVLVLPKDSVYYYQIGVQDIWGLESLSNIIKVDSLIKLFRNEFSIIGTRRLDLSSKNLFGPIPASINNLVNLEYLNLHDNYLQGPIPNSIYDLENIKVLNLSNNDLTGEISKEIHKLLLLEELWLSNNQITGNIPFQLYMLKDLKYLNLSDNSLEGTISAAIGNLEKLEYINLFDNQIRGFIPNQIGNLTNLEYVSLGRNQLVGTIPSELGDLSRLRSIALFENNLIGTIPHQMLNLKNLEYLGLSQNELEGHISGKLMTRTDLSYLRLDDNNFLTCSGDTICNSLYDWNNSIYYDISNNPFIEKIPHCLLESNQRDIKEMYLKYLTRVEN